MSKTASKKVTEFPVGSRVVYPTHGVGEIVGIETENYGGFEVKLYVISFIKDKMTLRVPVSRAKSSELRQLTTREHMDKVVTVLRGRARQGRGMWSRRAQEYEMKINSGDPVLIAEVIRDLHKNAEDPDRSYSERVIYESALVRLAGEYAAIEELKVEEATGKILDVLNDNKEAA